MKRLFILLFVLFVTAGVASAETADFENLKLDTNSYWNGSDEWDGFEVSNEFSSGDARFNNIFGIDDTYGPEYEYEYWYGFAYSNLTNTELSGQDSQYNAITGSGVNGSETYAVAYYSTPYGDVVPELPTISLDTEQVVSGMYITNINWAYYTMLEGDEVFMIDPFDSTDYFKVIVTGYDQNGTETNEIEKFLAKDGNIVNTWEWVDLRSLGTVKSIKFSMESSDESSGFINTPTYFAVDNFNGTAPGSDDDGSDSSTCFINAAGTSFFGTAR